MNKNIIKTSKKNKINAVGAETSVRLQMEKEKDNRTGRHKDAQPLQLLIKPKYENKIMSNNLTSNLQRPTSNTAITLIALIITIIILLILSGITLSMVMGESGIFGKANKASEQTKIANAEEIIKTAVLENEVYKNTGDEMQKDDTQLQEEIKKKLENEGYTINDDGTIKIGETTINIKEEIASASTGGKEEKSKNRTLAGTQTGYSYKNPVIPQGFKAVNVGNAEWSYKDSEKTEVTGWNEGLVIEDNIGNQFVWVPVDGSSVPYAKWCTVGTSYSDCSDDTSAIPVANENTQIDTYHGFYVARYEAGLTTTTTSQSASTNNNTNTTAVSMQGAKIWNYIDYNNANTVAKAMVNNTATYGNNKSGLVTGKQWDTIMKWYQNENIKVNTTQDWGTYYNLPYTIQGTMEKPALWFNPDSNYSTWSSSTQNVNHNASNGRYYHASGLNKNGIKKNIADIGGNVWEWTAEIYSSKRVPRGGGAHDSATGYPAYYRGGNSAGSTYYYLGFRVVLYVQ